MPERYDRIDHLLGNLIDSDTLTEWEYEFVNSVSGQFEVTKDLSDKQLNVLEATYRKDQVRR